MFHVKHSCGFGLGEIVSRETMAPIARFNVGQNL